MAWPKAGSGPWLALIASVILLPALPGILKLRHQPLIWGGYLVVLYFIAAVTEAWSDPPDRWPALVQAGLCLLYVAGLWATKGRRHRE